MKKISAKIACCIAVFAILFLGIMYYNNLPMTELLVDGIVQNQAMPLPNNVVFSQKIAARKMLLSGLQIRFGTYMRMNRGLLTVTLFENGKQIEQWHRPTEALEDNQFEIFELSDNIKMDPQKDYHFTITENYGADNTVAVWTNNATNAVYSVNGKNRKGELCYKLMGLTDFSVKENITVTFNSYAEKDIEYQVFYTEARGQSFNGNRSVKKNVAAGKQTVEIELPIKYINRFRLDIGSNPGNVEISDIRLKGEKIVLLDNRNFSYSQDVAEHNTDNEKLHIKSIQSDPYIVYLRDIDLSGMSLKTGK